MALSPFDASRLNGASGRARQILAEFTPGQKAVTAFALLGVLVGAFYFLTHNSSPSYTTLYANLQPTQAGQVTSKLSSSHIPYKLSDGGATVSVPAADVNQERITLAEAGLPSGNTVTFQTLASTGITSSQFVQNVDYQQALEGQLSSTIESIQGVNDAQVSLALPQTNSFAITNTQTTTASVLVDLADGTELSSGQVAGIVHLVASAVPGLSASNVTVVDSNGDVLSTAGAGASAEGDDAQTTAYDNQLADSLTTLVARVVGQDNAAVQVHAVLNFNQQSTTTNGFQLNKKGTPVTAPTAQSSTKETYTGNGAQAAGVLGSGQPASTSTNGQNGNYTSTQTQTTTAVGSVTQTVKQAPGQVTSTHVAVLVNSKAIKPGQLAAIRSLVTTAAGLNLKTGDAITVTALPFSPITQVAAAKPKALPAKLAGDAPDIGLVALILVLFALAVRTARKRSAVFEDIPLGELGGGDGNRWELAADPTMRADTMRTETMSAATSALEPAASPVTPEIGRYIAESPDEVAQLMRTWSQERPKRSVS
jgi:flagellar M-ring protein FliF